MTCNTVTTTSSYNASEPAPIHNDSDFSPSSNTAQREVATNCRAKKSKKKKKKCKRTAKDIEKHDLSTGSLSVSNKNESKEKSMENYKGSKYKSRSKSLLVVNADREIPKSRSLSFCVRKHVQWGSVFAREFTRFPGGGGAIPYGGSWALGLGMPTRDLQLGSVQEREEMRQAELQARTKQLSKSMRAHVRQGETRQFDYCRGVRNPLFSRLNEPERKKILIQDRDLDHEEMEERPETESRVNKKTSKTKKNDPEFVLEQDFSYICIQQNDEFTKIRDSRGCCGCYCGDMLEKVPKMNLKKLQHFLSSQHIAFEPKQPKDALMALAKQVAAELYNCSSIEHCECFKNGVPCHESGCNGCAKGCSNPNDRYVYDRKRVERYRKSLLEQWKQEHSLKMNPKPAVVHAA